MASGSKICKLKNSLSDIWARSLDDQLLLWIDVGEPTAERIKKASRMARVVKIYSFNRKSAPWREQGRDKFLQLKASFYRFEWESIQPLAALYQRTMQLSVTITGNSAHVATEPGVCEVPWAPLQA